jgi:hypothetical protein
MILEKDLYRNCSATLFNLEENIILSQNIFGHFESEKQAMMLHDDQLRSSNRQASSNKREEYLYRIYNQIIEDARRWSLFSLIFAGLGAALILLGLVLILFMLNITVGVMTSISGIVIQLVNRLAFRPTDEAIKRMEAILENLEELARMDMAIDSVARSDSDTRDHLYNEIVKKLLSSDKRKQRNLTQKLVQQPSQEDVHSDSS